MKNSILLFLFICTVWNVHGQCDPPAPPSNTCGNAPVVCDLDGWCGNSGGYTATSQPNAFCGTVENNCWVSFRAYTTFLEIEVSTSNCSLNNGVQAQMFYTEDCQFFTSVSNCLNPIPANDSRILVANNLIPGTIYHIMVDGKLFDFCDFSFNVLAGLTSPLADLQEEYYMCEVDTFSLGQEIFYLDAYEYTWTTDVGNFVTDPKNPTVDVDAVGTYTITVLDVPHGCIDTAVVQIVQSTPPVVAIDTPDTLDCSVNETIELNASSSEFGIGYTVEWLRFDGDTIASQLVQDDISIPGWYYLTLTNEIGCISRDSIEVFSGVDFPIANAGLAGELNCLNETIFLDGSNSSQSSNFQYEWLTPNGNIIGATDALITQVDQPGVYNLIVTNIQNDCWSADPVIITLNDAEPTDATIDIDTPCFGEIDGSIHIQEVLGGTPPYLYSLDTFTMPDIPFYQNLLPGEYPLTITDATGCTWDTIIMIDEPQPILLDLGPDLTIDLGDELTLNTNLNRPMEQIVWSPNPDSTCLYCESHTFQPLGDETYVVQAVDEYNCVQTDSVFLRILEKEKVYIPNAFSPNDDGINDVFLVFAGPDVAFVNNLSIFDRWGEMLYSQKNFEPNNIDVGWNGFFRNKRIDPQVLAYVAEILFINGEKKIYSGDLTVIY